MPFDSDITFFKANDTDLIYTLTELFICYGGGVSFDPYYNQYGEIMTYQEFIKVHKH